MSPRSQLCTHCKGVVSIPKGKGSRKLNLAQVVATHEATCPAILRINPKGKP